MQRSLVFAAACAAMLCAADAGQWAKPAWIPREEGLYRSQVHRGGGVRTRPDNSMESFLWSWGHGMAPEADARLTKDGMVIAFSVIASSTTTPKPSELANGISTALVTTLVGLVLAIPAIIFLGVMKNRLARLTLEVGIISEGLMSRFDTKK